MFQTTNQYIYIYITIYIIFSASPELAVKCSQHAVKCSTTSIVNHAKKTYSFGAQGRVRGFNKAANRMSGILKKIKKMVLLGVMIEFTTLVEVIERTKPTNSWGTAQFRLEQKNTSC